MGQVIAINAPIEKLVVEIRAHVHDAGRAENTCAKHQLQAGLRLIELRAAVERDGGDWWAFFDEKFTGYIKNRKYAEKLMRWARSDDPEGAINAERERVREAVQESRKRAAADDGSLRNNPKDQSETDLVEKALRIVARMSTDEREDFHQRYMERFQ